MNTPSSPSGDRLTSRVVMHHGAPTLFINNQPDTGLMLYHNTVERGVEEIADFAAAGIDLLTTGLGGIKLWQEDNTIAFEAIDQKMALILAANPRALVLPRVGLAPPAWWVERHPEAMMIHRDPYLGETVEGEYRSVSFASAAWREDIAPVLRRIIHYLEEHYSLHILGYHLCAGECGEWSYIWRHYTQSDYSPAQVEAYAAWRTTRGLCPAEIPADWRCAPDAITSEDQLSDPALRDYLTFHSDVVADAILHFSAVAKATLRERQADKIVAIFYGYHFTPPGQPSAFTDSGHHALSRILASPEVDALCAPYSYHAREHGGVYYSQLVAGSVRLHGKLIYSEDDTVTHLVPPHPYRYHCPDGFASKNVILRNILGALRDGGTAWYMDWFGQNWYRDQDLMASFTATQKMAQRRLQYDNHSVAEIAVFVSESTAFRIKPQAPDLVPWALEPLAEIMRCGAPVDTYLLTDLPQALNTNKTRPYRLLVFLDLVLPDPKEREAVTVAEASGISLLWVCPSSFYPTGSGAVLPTPLDAALFRKKAIEAGVHLYSSVSDYVAAEDGLLTVHASITGERTLSIPEPRTWVDAMTGKTAFANRSQIAMVMRQGETRVWELFLP
jgi:hypothetical protein